METSTICSRMDSKIAHHFGSMSCGKRTSPKTVSASGRLVPVLWQKCLSVDAGDDKSFLTLEPDWKPFLPTVDTSTQGHDFFMIDLLRFAGVG